MSLTKYWPTVEEINNCIKSEAETAPDEVLLAVHQEFPIAYSKVGADGKVVADGKIVATEDQLIKHLLGDAPEGSLIVPITGASGVGKSHLIRMLDARIRRLMDRDKYLVIRIPKSASLRRVVGLILESEPLRSAKYNAVKTAFNKALGDVSSVEDAVVRFQGELDIALRDYAKEVTQRLYLDQTNAELQARLSHALKLPVLMADAVTVGHFREKVFPRIIQRAVVGIEVEGGEIREVGSEDGQFQAEDLNLSLLDIGAASKEVDTYYRLSLETRGGVGKTAAVDVLNSVVDQATRQLYQLNGALGGMTLGDVILEIRRHLLAENKELVILVEDFKALVGIQDTLAKLLIQEGVTSEGRKFATIRSAIAVTDGYLGGRDTLATRAGREWVVESRLDSEDEALRRTKRLVAAYLNAARCGEGGLRKHYQEFFADTSGEPREWLPPIYSDKHEEDEEALKAFGYEGKVPLFPFTESAVECLARSAMSSGNTLVFNPRFVIKNIVREVLLLGRGAFLEKKFPPPSLKGGSAGADVSEWLMSMGLVDEQKQRYRRLVAIWANAPQHREEIGRIPAKIFEVFSLPPPANIKFIASIPGDSKLSIASPPTNTPAPQEAQALEGFRRALEGWVQEKIQLEQKVANKIRKALAALINQRIDWNAERCQKREIRADVFSIPYSSGEGGLAADAFKIAADNTDTDGKLRGELLALLRYHDLYDRQTEYEDADEDLARISNLLDRLMPAALDMARASSNKQSRAAIYALAANGRMLGIRERGQTIKALSSFLLGDVAPLEGLPDEAAQTFKDWRALQSKGVQSRGFLRKLVLEAGGCFQGTGEVVYGVDIVRIAENFPDKTYKFNLAELKYIPQDLKQPLQNMSDITVRSRANQVLIEATKLKKRIEQDLGENFEKNLVVDASRALAEKLGRGVWKTEEIGCTASAFLTLCESFRSSALKDSLLLLQEAEGSVESDEAEEKTVARVAKLSFVPLIIAGHFLDKASKVVDSANGYANSLEQQYEGVSPSEKIKEIKDEFNLLILKLTALQKRDE